MEHVLFFFYNVNFPVRQVSDIFELAILHLPPLCGFFLSVADLSSPKPFEVEGELGLWAGYKRKDRSEVCVCEFAGGVIFHNSLLRPLAGDVGVKP